jgi:hypothetical protein
MPYKRNEAVVCRDGFRMSVQAHDGAYCSPRIDDAEKYTQVEVAYPSHAEEIIMPWAENPDEPTETVYGYVPVSVVTNVIAKHGGILRGQVPNGVAYLNALDDFLVDTSDKEW